MKFQSSMRHVQILTMLAGVAVAFPAVAQERASEPPLKSRDAKTAEAAAPTVDLKIEGIRNGLQIRVLQKEEGPAPEGGRTTSCNEDCELKLPAGSYTLIASQIEPQEEQGEEQGTDLQAPPRLTMSGPDAASHRLGTALGFGGILAAVVGSYMTIGALSVRHDTAGFPSGLNGFFYAGLAGIGVGAGLMIGGFSLAAANRVQPTAVDQIPSAVQRRGLIDTGISLSGTF